MQRRVCVLLGRLARRFLAASGVVQRSLPQLSSRLRARHRCKFQHRHANVCSAHVLRRSRSRRLVRVRHCVQAPWLTRSWRRATRWFAANGALAGAASRQLLRGRWRAGAAIAPPESVYASSIQPLVRLCQAPNSKVPKCGLTTRSSGAPSAGRLGRAAPWFMLHRAAKPACRWRPLSSNVRPQ